MNQMTILPLLFLMANIFLPLMVPLTPIIMTTMMTVTCTLVKTSRNVITPSMSAITQIPRPMNTVTGFTQNWMHNP